MDVFSSQLRIVKCSEIRHFSMKFPSEGEFWHCHFANKKLGSSNQITRCFKSNRGQKTRKCEKSDIQFHLLYRINIWGHFNLIPINRVNNAISNTYRFTYKCYTFLETSGHGLLI